MSAIQITASNSIAYKLPLTSGQNQEYDISLAGVTYHLRFKWNYFAEAWVLDIEDSQQNVLLGGIALVTGADLLEQYAYLNFGGALVVQSTNDPNAVPDFNSLGVTGNLFFLIFV